MMKFLWTVLLVAFIGKGVNCQEKCSKDDLVIRQRETSVWIHGAAQLEVSILNECPCFQSHVKLTCYGFQSLEGMDPITLVPVQSGDVCLLNNGSSIGPFSEAKFTYAWDDPFPFKAVYSVINCD